MFAATEQWSYAYDATRRRLFMTNGECPLLTYDGRRLRRASSGWTDRQALIRAVNSTSCEIEIECPYDTRIIVSSGDTEYPVRKLRASG